MFYSVYGSSNKVDKYLFTSKYIYFTKVNGKYFIYFTYLLFGKSKVNVPPLRTIITRSLANARLHLKNKI